MIIQGFEIKEVLGDQEYEELTCSNFNIEEIPGLVKCRCGNMWITEKGSVNIHEKGEDGKVISEAAAIHKS